MEHEEDFEMKPLKATIMAMLFFMAYLVSLGGWWLIEGYPASGTAQRGKGCLGEILDIIPATNPSTASL